MNTTEMVRAARERNPNAKASEISDELGISRARVGQILKSLGLPTRVFAPRTRTAAANRYRYGISIPSGMSGSVSELEVCADLMKRGFPAFRSVSYCSSCDVITIINGRCIQIEVRSSKNGKCATHGTYDCLAAVEPDGTIVYHPDLNYFTK